MAAKASSPSIMHGRTTGWTVNCSDPAERTFLIHMPFKPRKRLPAFVVPLLITVTLAKILVFLILVRYTPLVPFVGDNAADHLIPVANRLITEGRFNGPDTRPDSKVPPGYPLVLAFLMRVSPIDYRTAAVVCQMLADLLTGTALIWLASRFLAPTVAIVAGVAWLLYPPEIVISTWITAETFFTTLLICGIASLSASLHDDNAMESLLAGCVLGIATLFRGTTLLLPAMLLLPMVRIGLFRCTALFLAGFLLLVTPWAIRNRVVLNDPILVSVGFGSAFLQGSDERAFTIAGKRAAYPQMYAEAARHGVVKPPTDHESAIDHWLFEVGLLTYKERVIHRPLSLLSLTIKKVLLLWYSTESGGFNGQLLLGLCALPVVVPGLWQLWKWNGTPIATLLASVLVYFILLHVATLPLNRYMLPVYPILLLGASEWWMSLIQRHTRWRVGSDSPCSYGQEREERRFEQQ